MAEPLTLPFAADVERVVLGSILLDNSKYRQAQELTADHFALDSHRRIFARIAELIDVHQRTADIVTVSEQLRRHQQLESVGGAVYLSSLTDGIVTRTSIRHYVDIVVEKWRARRIIEACNLAMHRAYEQCDPVDDILADLSKNATGIIAEAPDTDADIFVPASVFIRQAQDEIDWRVHKIIEVGTSGIIVGLPKSGKTPLATELAVALSTGTNFLEMATKQCRVGLVSREDYTGTTSRRIKRLLQGRQIDTNHLFGEDWLWVNTRQQSASMMLDNMRDLATLIKNVKRHKTEFLILDVLNVLHSADENDNTEMRVVLKRIETIRDETGCQVCVLHHSRKDVPDDASLAEAARGSTAIAGFAEFILYVKEIDEHTHTRRIRFLCKSGESHWPFYWHIRDLPSSGGLVIERTDWAEEKPRKKAAWAK